LSGSKSVSTGYIDFVVLVVPVNPEFPLVFLVIQGVLASDSSCYSSSGVPMVLEVQFVSK
jgi:hypothetical protein